MFETIRSTVKYMDILNSYFLFCIGFTDMFQANLSTKASHFNTIVQYNIKYKKPIKILAKKYNPLKYKIATKPNIIKFDKTSGKVIEVKVNQNYANQRIRRNIKLRG